MNYDHRYHAGNAGDVWKHFILSEAVEWIMAREKRLVYVESHVGFPQYSLKHSGEWLGGIGRCWEHLEDHLEISYFGIIAGMNPAGLSEYPGSGQMVLKMAKNCGIDLQADVWDIDPEVAVAWRHYMTIRRSDQFRFHLGDGFSGVRSLLETSRPALLLIDPPYIDRRDASRALDLARSARSFGWTVLWWRMMDERTIQDSSCDSRCFSLNYADAKMSCGKWSGAQVALMGDADLLNYLDQRAKSFLEIIQSL